MKKIIITVMVFFIFIIKPITANAATTTEVYIPSELVVIDYIETETKEELLILMSTYEQELLLYDQKLRTLNHFYELNSPVLQEINNQIIIAQKYYDYYKEKYDKILAQEQEAIWEIKKQQYPIACKIWEYLKDAGYNDYVCAGIMGNIMTEAGGQTLNINWSAINETGNYYGICQWSMEYYPQLWKTNLDYQLNHLKNSMEYQFNTYGKNYKKNFNYNDFCNLTDEKKVALAFAKCYERCSSDTHKIRQENATIAYEYFVKN